MKFIKLDLLTLLISLFLFASCENTSTIGLQLDPSNTIQGSLIDSATILSRTQKEDPVSTIGAIRYPLGFLKDPIFGNTEASLAMSVSLPYAAYDFGTSAVVDSAVLVLNYGGQFYGDSTATYSFDVHELNINLGQQETFLSNKEYPYFATLIGNKTGKLYPTTSYKVTDVVAGKPDTLRNVTPQIRIRLDKTFIQNKIANGGAANLLNQTAFEKWFNGLHVQLNKTNSTGNGGIAFVEFANSKSELAIYYKKQNATTASLIDTVNVSFPISSSSVPITATLKHDYTGTQVATQLSAPPTTQFAVTYLQPLAGLKTKIGFPYLGKLAENLGKVVVNKAELVIDMSSGTDVIPYGAASRLSLYRFDIAERRQNLPDNNPSTQYSQGDPRAVSPAVFGGYYNSVTRQYIFTVTSYVQDLLDKKTVDYGTFLAPTPATSVMELYPSISTAARTVIGSFKKNPAAGDNVIKLNIYYTKIN